MAAGVGLTACPATPPPAAPVSPSPAAKVLPGPSATAPPSPTASPSPTAPPAPIASAGLPASPAGDAATAGSPDPAAIEAAYKGDGYVRINQAAITGTSAHSGPLVLYVNKASAPLYKKGFKGVMPAGTTVIKVSEEEGQIFAIMAKMKAGSDPAARDWFYYEKLGSTVIDPGKGGGFCNSCHAKGPETDLLLGTEVFGQ